MATDLIKVWFNSSNRRGWTSDWSSSSFWWSTTIYGRTK